MQVIEAQCLWVLAPHDHLHIKQLRMVSGLAYGGGTHGQGGPDPREHPLPVGPVNKPYWDAAGPER